MALHPLRTRLAALVLLFVSPSLAGLAVDAAHPCPEQAPWTVEDAEHHHGEPSSEHHDCRCVGACQTAVAATLDTRDGLAATTPVLVFRPAGFHFQLIGSGRPFDRLPPATAPPSV